MPRQKVEIKTDPAMPSVGGGGDLGWIAILAVIGLIIYLLSK